MDNIITIPKNIAKEDLVIISRREYEALLSLKKIKEFEPTAIEIKNLRQAEKNFISGKTLSFDEFSKKLGFRN
ncbi:MAG: hypothetical protein Q8L36_01770 [bacterium]|nr:hypothetical protein [bacterium]